MRAVDLALDNEGAWDIAWHEDIRLQSGMRGIRRRCSAGIAGGGDGDPRHPQFRGTRNRQSQATRLKGASRVEGLILDIEMVQAQALAQTLGPQERGHTFA